MQQIQQWITQPTSLYCCPRCLKDYLTLFHFKQHVAKGCVKKVFQNLKEKIGDIVVSRYENYHSWDSKKPQFNEKSYPVNRCPSLSPCVEFLSQIVYKKHKIIMNPPSMVN